MDIIQFIVVFLAFLAVGMPVAFSMLTTSTIYFLLADAPLIGMLPDRLFGGLDMFILVAIPFFLMAGELMNRAGISDRLINFSNMVVGRMRGGLAQVNVLSSVLFAGITGIALGDVVALGKIFIPAMEKQGYTRAFAGAVTGASSLLGPIIPPSTIAVLYAAIMGVSVGGIFVAAIVPGLLIALSDMIVVYIIARRREFPTLDTPFTVKALAVGFRDASLAIVMPLIIVCGILAGLFTPTEAAAVAVIYAILVGIFILRSLKSRDLIVTLRVSAIDTARLLIIIAGAAAVGWIFAIENVPEFVDELFSPIKGNMLLLVLFVNLFFLFMGTWLDPATSIILFAPIIGPMAYSAGLHPLQFGIMMVINSNIGYISPPVGNVLFAVANICRVSIWALAKDLFPFILINFLVVIVVGLVPELSLWLPRLVGLVD
jgi:tripartite ATP-independent transporter DctM subunit